MPLVPGLVPNIRQPGAPEEALPPPIDVIVESADESGEDIPEFDDKGNIIKIEHGDGSVTVSLDGRPISSGTDTDPGEWFDNLVDKIDQAELSRISEDLLRGIRDDIESRKEWIEDRANGVKLLGLKLEVPGLGGSSDGAPVEGMSKVRHPLLLEAVLRFQANARSEMLPTDGPVKIRNDDNNSDIQEDLLANCLERDLNHYLTAVASEYYPDTDRMLLMLGFGGTAFKKVYYCPLRNRPVSETVDADDLIVNNAATDLRNAKRITHRVYMRPSTVKRLQLLKVYRDVSLQTPNIVDLDSFQREEKSQQGISMESINPDDRDREIYECYCELDIKGFEHKYKGEITGLEIPYRVTIDVSSKEILSIVRNYDEDSEELPESRDTFVKYTFAPGFGFYDIGLLHILGNTTNAVTAAWRELLDAGMYSNFPGFLFADTGARQNTNIFRVPPGGGQLVKTGGMPIRDAIMPLPYKEPSQALMALVGDMSATGMRIGGTSEQQVGEGKADAPVGTTLALIEQAQKVLNAVHKRMHASQAFEFQLLVRVFKEHPKSFWQNNKRAAKAWDEETFLRALDNCELVPQADPNTASYTQRVMKIMALKQLQAANPTMYDPIAIDRAAIQAIGWANPEQFLAPPSAQQRPPPELQQMQSEMAVKQQDAASRAKMANAKAAEIQHRIQNPEPQQQPGQSGPNPMDLQLKAKDLEIRQQQNMFTQQRASIDDQNRDKDRQAQLAMTQAKLIMDKMKADEQMAHDRDLEATKQQADHSQFMGKQLSEHLKQSVQHAHDRDKQKFDVENRPKPKPGLGGKNG